MNDRLAASDSPAPAASSDGSTTRPVLSAEDDRALAERRKITRKSHRKSRLGCRNCKTRRIKCDENKPQCGNCIQRRVSCDYPSQSTSGPGSNTLSDADLPISEIELTYYWTTSTYQSLSAWNTGAIKWRGVMPEIAFDHPHVLHLILALTALHLAHCRPDRREEYHTRADYYYGQALGLLTSELATVSPDSYLAVSTSAQLMCFVGLGKGPQPGEYLAFTDGGLSQSEWLIMFRGVRATRESQVRLDLTQETLLEAVAKGRPLPQDPNPPDFERQLHDLHGHVDFVTSHDETTLEAVNVLLEIYRGRYDSKDGEYHVAFGWLYRMNDKFLEQLQRREPLPLIIYAHFIVLLQDMERFWYMKGWTHHVMGGIWRSLPEAEKPWLGWPVERVGWIPP